MNQSKANTIQAYLRQTEQRLAQAGFSEAGREARLLLAHLLCQSPAALPLWPGSLSPVQQATLEGYLIRRLAGEPLQYVLGETEFMSLPFAVSPAVLIPRGDTERIVEAAIARLGAWSGPLRIADLCCGSGAIGISLAHFLPRAQVWASDISAAALDVAQANAAQNGVAERMHFLQGDLFAPFAGLPPFAAILTNPPYIPSGEMPYLQAEVRREPALALDGGRDGLDYYRRLIPTAREYLQAGGLLFLETGYDQRESVGSLLLASGYAVLQTIRDYGQNHRGFVAQKSEK